MIAWMLKGCTQERETTKHLVKQTKSQEGEKEDEGAESNGSAEADEEESKSASASVGRKLKN